ncbi:hypothetical protein ES703_30961 [subsurface metagenome]
MLPRMADLKVTPKNSKTTGDSLNRVVSKCKYVYVNVYIQKRGTNASSISAGSGSSYSKKGHKRIKHFRRLKLILFKKGAQTHQAFSQAQAHLIQKRGTNVPRWFASRTTSHIPSNAHPIPRTLSLIYIIPTHLMSLVALAWLCLVTPCSGPRSQGSLASL